MLRCCRPLVGLVEGCDGHKGVRRLLRPATVRSLVWLAGSIAIGLANAFKLGWVRRKIKGVSSRKQVSFGLADPKVTISEHVLELEAWSSVQVLITDIFELPSEHPL